MILTTLTVKCNKVMGTSYFDIIIYRRMLGYGFVGTMRQTAHVYFSLSQALIAYFFTLNIVYMNKQMKLFGQY